MYTKQEASLLTQQFWTAFGGYMAPVLSAEGEKINWVNYKTGEKDIRFVITTGNSSAILSILLSHKDTALQQWYFDKFLQLKERLQQVTGDDWVWDLFTSDQHGKTLSKIYVEIAGVNVLNRHDWPAIISFLKTWLTALDIFWCEFRYAFERSGF